MSKKPSASAAPQKSTLFSFGFSKAAGAAAAGASQLSSASSTSSTTPAQPQQQLHQQKNISAKKDDVLGDNNNKAMASSVMVVEDEDQDDVIAMPQWTEVAATPPKATAATTTASSSSHSAAVPPVQPQPVAKRSRVVDSDDEIEMDFGNTQSKPSTTTTTTTTTTTKRARQASSSSSSESSSSDEASSSSSSEDEDDDEGATPSRGSKPTKQPVKSSSSSSTSKPKATTTTKSPAAKMPKLAATPPTTTSSSPGAGAEDDEGNNGGDGPSLALRFGQHDHHSLPFLKQPRDKAGRKPSDAEYDQTTLSIPKDFLSHGVDLAMNKPGAKAKKISEGQQVWWSYYTENFDCVLAYKVGKFYEMYNSCADVGTRVCGLQYMKGAQAHCGFPESKWDTMSIMLVEAGYRVARIEQTETPAQQQERTGKGGGQLRRELCSILSRGTLMLTERDGRPAVDARRQLVSVTELDGRIGVCVLDATTGRFRVGDFEKDSHLVQLTSMLALEAPAELVYCPSALSPEVLRVLKSETLSMHTTYNKERASKIVNVASLFDSTSTTNQHASSSSSSWQAVTPPAALALIQTLPSVARNALNLSLLVLQRALIADELASMGRFELYQPLITPASSSASTGSSSSTQDATTHQQQQQQHASLDASALRHLEVLSSNSLNGNVKGSLLAYLDRTSTSFGSRCMREWVSKPLFKCDDIYRRSDAVTMLLRLINEGHSSISNFVGALKKCPDLERAMNRIHCIGSAKRASSHPDSRAVLYEAADVNAIKIKMLAEVLDAFKSLSTATDALQKAVAAVAQSDNAPVRKCTSSNMLQECLNTFRDASLQACIRDMDRGFDSAQARKTGTIDPRPGVSKEYDEALALTAKAKQDVEQHLIDAKKIVKSDVKFFGSGKQSFQLECKDSVVTPSNWSFTSKKQGFKRYTHADLQASIEELTKAQVQLASASSDVNRAVFAKFDASRDTWTAAVKAVTELDCILSLAHVARDGTSEEPMCVPELVDGSVDVEPYLKLVRSRHPCVARALEESGKVSFIPNDICLGAPPSPISSSSSSTEHHHATINCNVLLLSGPNMGGKSTLLRQTCVAALMAQIGSYVPAAECHMTLVDRVFTRLGANDRIMHGESTFFVELSEAAQVLNHATRNSLVILDELGRGTSTFDGTAIAHAVLEELVTRKCRVIFASHYHELIREVGKRSAGGVSLGHMVCLADAASSSSVGGGNSDGAANGGGGGDEERNITFLFKLAPGSSDKSYGLNVARLARLPSSVIERADEVSRLFEGAFLRFVRQQLITELKEAVRTRNEDMVPKLVDRAKALFF